MKWAVLLLAIGFVGGFYVRHQVDGAIDTVSHVQERFEQVSAMTGWLK